jgi:type II secretory ATPase GspE/PulE/Tfp pilus assembly ATPase PilB-like protein
MLVEYTNCLTLVCVLHRSQVLNEDQMKIIEYIAAESQGFCPPLIVYGPFGTGKTETIAQAAMVLGAQKMGFRILICTHSNR